MVGIVGGCNEVLVEVSRGENGSLEEREDGSRGKVNLMDWHVERSFKSAVYFLTFFWGGKKALVKRCLLVEGTTKKTRVSLKRTEM